MSVSMSNALAIYKRLGIKVLKEAMSRYLELFLGRGKLSFIGRKPLNNSFPG